MVYRQSLPPQLEVMSRGSRTGNPQRILSAEGGVEANLREQLFHSTTVTGGELTGHPRWLHLHIG